MLRELFIVLAFCFSFSSNAMEVVMKEPEEDDSDQYMQVDTPGNVIMSHVRAMIGLNDEGKILMAGCALYKLIKEGGADINQCDTHDEYPLGLMARYGNAEMIDAFIKLGADVNPAYSYTPLMYAASNTDPTVMKTLLDNKADVSRTCPDKHDKTPLLLALEQTSYEYLMGYEQANKEKVQLLIDAKSDVQAQASYPNCYTCIQYTIDGHAADLLSLLLESGAEMTDENTLILKKHIRECNELECAISSFSWILEDLEVDELAGEIERIII